jgi:hypothetical protein
MYIIDLNKLIQRLVPPILSKPVFLAWAQVLLSPIKVLWSDANDYRNQIIEFLRVNISIASLQYTLRQRYPDIGSFRCYVRTVYDNFPTYYSSFRKEHHLLEEYDYFQSEGQADVSEWFRKEHLHKCQYNVIIPTAYISMEVEVITFLDTYRPAGRQYQLRFQDL